MRKTVCVQIHPISIRFGCVREFGVCVKLVCVCALSKIQKFAATSTQRTKYHLILFRKFGQIIHPKLRIHFVSTIIALNKPPNSHLHQSSGYMQTSDIKYIHHISRNYYLIENFRWMQIN